MGEENQKKYKDYEDFIVDVDEIAGTDVKINPDFYIHSALLKAQIALTKDNMKEGFIQFRVLVEHIEILCKAANMITEDYDDELEKYKKTDEYKNEEDKLTKATKLSNKKLGLLMTEVFSSKISTGSLKV